MLNRNALRGEIARNGLTQKDVAKLLNISEKTFISRMKSGVFYTNEVQILIEKLNITNPMEIFFANLVTQ